VTGFLQQLLIIRPGWLDFVEILIVAFLIYRVLLLLRRGPGMYVLFGLVFLVGVYFLARALGLVLIRGLLEATLQYGAIAALVVFQPELRSALSRLGQSRMFQMITLTPLFSRLEETQVVDEVVEAVDQLARSKVGAIIAIEGQVGLDEYCESGRSVEARVSSHMLTTIFTPYSPLHDGAAIITADRIKAAGVILPLTQTPIRDRSLGTRHRAALGLSEETDALVIVVSEETSRVSVAYRGRLDVGVDSSRLREVLGGGALAAAGSASKTLPGA